MFQEDTIQFTLSEDIKNWAQIITILLVKYSDFSLGSFKPITIIIMTVTINAFIFFLK